MVTGFITGTDGIIVLIVALVVIFGGSQLPKLARNVGSAGREFRKAQQEAEEEAARERARGAAAQAAAPGAAAAPPALDEERVTMTRAQLDALLRAKEEEARHNPTSPA